MEETKTTTLASLQVPAMIADVPVGFSNSQGFELLQRGARALSTSNLVPETYRGAQGLGNCMIALEMANRIQASPLLVMQNLYVVHGRPSWSAQFLIATFNACGRFSALRYEWFGTEGQDDWGCRAWAIEKATGEKLLGARVDVALAKAEGWANKTGSKWKTMPQQMLMYRAASWFVRAYAPELSMGLHTKEEIEDGFEDQPQNLTVTMADIGKPQEEVIEAEVKPAKKAKEKPPEPQQENAPDANEPPVHFISQPDHLQAGLFTP